MTELRIHDTQLHITREAAEEGSRLVPAQTLLAVVRGMSLATEFRIALTQREMAFNQDIKALVPADNVVPEFLFYALLARRDHIRELATEASHGTKKLETDVLAAVSILLPKPDTQRKIIETLTAYDDFIENNQRRMALLEDAVRQLYHEWFVRLRFPGHEHTCIIDGVPQGWERLAIADLINQKAAELQTGPFGTQLKASEYSTSGTPVINVRNIGLGELRAERLEFVPEEVADRLSRHLLRDRDIVFGRKGAVDRHLLVTRATSGYIQGSDCIRLRLLSLRVSPFILSFSFREDTHKQWMLTQCGNKATMPSLNQDVIGRIEAVMPPHHIVAQFDEFAAVIVQQMDNLRRQNQKLSAARDLLLPRLMSGEIAV